MINLPKSEKSKLFLILTIIAFVFLMVISLFSLYNSKAIPSEVKILPTPIAVQTPSPKAPIKFSDSQISTSPSGSFTLTVVPDSQLQALVYRLEIHFDPKILSVTSVQNGLFFKNPTILRNEINNDNGIVDFSTGIALEEIKISGQPNSANSLALISFKVKSQNLTTPQDTTVSFGDKTQVLGKDTINNKDVIFNNNQLNLKPVVINIK